MEVIDSRWAAERVQSGLSSGEGLIWAVRDDSTDNTGPYLPGVKDKRLLFTESEFARVLQVGSRDTNVVSTVIRQAWDTGNLRIVNKNSPVVATGAHISIIGHITFEDLQANLKSTDAFNGFGNRFLWTLARRTRLLPEGGRLDEAALQVIAQRMKDVVSFARTSIQELKWDETARRRWHEIYRDLSEEQFGTYGAITSRAEAQVLRLACVYAVLDGSPTISIQHLEAALEVWRYCDASARIIFGDLTPDPIENRIADAIRANPRGLTRTELRDLFKRNVPGDQIDRALDRLERTGGFQPLTESTTGRPAERWFYVGRGGQRENVEVESNETERYVQGRSEA
jgi:hypothetical protein